MLRRSLEQAVGLAGGCLLSVAVGAQALSPQQFVDEEFLASGTLALIRAQYAYAQGHTGKGVTVAVGDSGLDIFHPEFQGRVSPWRRNFVPGWGWDDVVDIDPATGGILGHGTHVAGLVGAARDGRGMHGTAYEATILPLRMRPYWPDQAYAYEATAELGAQVFNGSFGPTLMPQLYVTDPATGQMVPNPNWELISRHHLFPFGLDLYAEGARLLASADVVQVYSAGNSYNDQPLAAGTASGAGMVPLITPANTASGAIYRYLDDRWPIDPQDVNTWQLLQPDHPAYDALMAQDFSDLRGALITVVATGRDGVIASYSNRCGAAADWCLAAPGGDFLTPGWPGDTGQAWSTYPYGSYAYMAGTSMASPVTAGAAAVLRGAFPYMSARQIIEIMLTTANDTGLWADRDTYGWGMLDLGRAVDGPVLFGSRDFFAPIFAVDTAGHDSVWRNAIGGPGGLRKAGAGTLRLTAASSYSGPTEVAGGTLAVDGSIAASALTIAPQGRLAGVGEVGPTQSRGTVAPGNSIGTLTVRGDYVQHAGATLDIELGEGGHDVLRVTGSAQLQGGHLTIDGLKPGHIGGRYEVLQAGLGVSGGFESVGPAYVFVGLSAPAVGGAMQLRVDRNAVPFSAWGRNANQRAVAAAMDGQPAGHAARDSIVLLRPAEAGTLAARYDALAGEIHTAAVPVLHAAASAVDGAVRARGRAAADAPFLPAWATAVGGRGAVWGQALGRWGRSAGGGEFHGLRRHLGGTVMGADMALGVAQGDEARPGRLGLAWSYTQSRARGRDGDSLRDTAHHAVLYGGWRWGGWTLDGGLAHGWHRLDSRRSLAAAGFGPASADASARSLRLFAEASYRHAVGRYLLAPYLGVSQEWLRIGRLQERGSAASLRAASERYRIGSAELGMRVSANWELSHGGRLAATAGLGWRHRRGDLQPERQLAFVQGGAYRLRGAPLARNALAVSAGMDWQPGPRSRWTVAYDGEFGKGQEHGASLRFAWTF